MTNTLEELFTIHQEKLSLSKCIKSGIKGFIAITILAGLSNLSNLPLVLAPFGASCILIFTSPTNQFSQPINVVGGYFIASSLSVVFAEYFPHEWWVPGLALGVTISAMAAFRMSHPPAGAIPLVTFYYYDHLDWTFILFPSFSGSMTLIAIALILHRIPFARRKYPKEYP